jgi:methylmalonyl-CoA mutase
MSDNSKKLFGEFPPISTQAWKDKIVTDLKGADFDKKLVWKPIEGFEVQPYYRQEDLEKLTHLGSRPGQFPFVRGKKRNGNHWFTRQDIVVENPKAANKKALDVLMRGADSLGFVIGDANAYSQDDVAELLQDLDFSAIELCFVVKQGKTNLLKILKSYIAKAGIDPKTVKGSINIDYLGNLTLKGAFCYDSEQKCHDFVKEAYELGKDLPNFQICEVHADYFQNAGSTCAQELGLGLAVGAEYLAQAVERGIDAGAFAPKMKFNFAVGNNYFMEIAKLRAAKMLWAKIVAAYKPQCGCTADCNCAGKCHGDFCTCSCKMNLHCITATYNKTLYDPYANMLRTTTEAMSAALGGADSITVLPFNAFFEQPTEFSERIARNQQSVLKEESYLDKIVDPAGGSYYIETLTDKIATSAWELFLALQDKGGYAAAFKAGYVQEIVGKTAEQRIKNVATRRQDFLGTNQFPNFNEALDAGLDQTLLAPVSLKCEKAIAEPIKLCRGPQAIEALRFATDKYSAANSRPLAFMLTIGNLNFRKARAQFMCNFLACGGFGVADNNGFDTIAEGVQAAKKAGAKIIVLCSSDEEYETYAPEALKEIAGQAQFIVAGAPACMDALKEKGVKNFVNMRSNLLETLSQLQKELGIA